MEEEDEEEQTRLTLVVHPEIGKIDKEKILSRLREAFGAGIEGSPIHVKDLGGCEDIPTQAGSSLL